MAKEETRTKRTLANTVYGTAQTLVNYILRFVMRSVINVTVGTQLLGLNSLFTSILGFLSLAELGFGSAIVFALYKPVAEKDYDKIASLLNIYKRIYWVVGSVITVAGCACMPFLEKLINGTPPEGINLYIVFAITLANTVIGYFFSYKRSLLYAYQRNDICSKISSVIMIVLNTAQIIILYTTRNYYFYIAVMPVTTLAENIAVSILANKICGKFSKGKPLPKEERKALKKNMFAMIGHKIGSVAVSSTSNIVISAFLGLTIVAHYNNYYTVTHAVEGLIIIFFTSMQASVGNSVAKESREKNYSNFKNINFFNIWAAGFCFICFLTLFQDFIPMWMGADSLLPMSTVILMCLAFILKNMRKSVLMYHDVSGVFYQDRFKPYVEAIVNLATAIVLGKYYGLNGVILASILSNLLVAIPAETYVTFKHYFNRSAYKYYLNLLVWIAVIAAGSAITYFTCAALPSGGLMNFICKFLLCLVLPNMFFTLVFFWRPEFKFFLNFFDRIFTKLFSAILRRLKRKKNTNAIAAESDAANNNSNQSAQNELLNEAAATETSQNSETPTEPNKARLLEPVLPPTEGISTEINPPDILDD